MTDERLPPLPEDAQSEADYKIGYDTYPELLYQKETLTNLMQEQGLADTNEALYHLLLEHKDKRLPCYIKTSRQIGFEFPWENYCDNCKDLINFPDSWELIYKRINPKTSVAQKSEAKKYHDNICNRDFFNGHNFRNHMASKHPDEDISQ
jgi:hypothetical protein